MDYELLTKENDQLRRQNEMLKETIQFLSKQLNFYRTNYEKMMRDLEEIAK